MADNKIKINMDSLKSRKEWRRHKIKDGHNVFRILPPFGPNSNGYVSKKWQIIWGLKDPESGRARPFASSITSEKRCPVTELVKELRDRLDSIKAQMQASGASEADIRESLANATKLVSDLSPKTIYVYNAVDRSGEVGLLELKSTAHKKMKTEMSQYIQDYNQDPTSLNSSDDDSGVWFDITRQGMGRDTQYDVKKFQTKRKDPATGRITFEDDRSPLPDNVVNNYDSLGYDLTSVYQVKSYDELSDILDANLPDLMSLAPELFEGTQVKVEVPTKTAPVKTKVATITTKFDDEDISDDDDVFEPAPVTRSQSKTVSTKSAAAATTKSTIAIDDDFMAQAEQILNG